MLSRVADSLYWMSRHIERAENIARIVDVNLQLMLDVPAKRAQQLSRNWLPIVSCLGEDEAFLKRYKKADLTNVVEYLVFDREHPNSIVGAICSARENARTVREQITSEMWEQINRVYLWVTAKSARQAYERNQYEFFQTIKQMLQLFQGITDTTSLHSEGWEFIQVGKYLERADKTSRVLDEDFHLLRQAGATQNDHLLQWLAVLRSCSARQTYQRIYESGVQPVKVAELLLLNENSPRSVQFCVYHTDQALRRISGVATGRFSNRAEKISGRLLAELSFSNIDDIYSQGLHRAMDDLQVKLNQIGFAIYETYIHQELPVETVTEQIVAEPQQQQ